MTLRDRIIGLFRLNWRPQGVRELLTRMPGANRASVSKECLFLASCGLLVAVSEANANHGRRFVFGPTALLADAGRRALGPKVIMAVVRASGGIGLRDLRTVLNCLCDCRVSLTRLSGELDSLAEAGQISIEGMGRSPVYRAGAGAPWRALTVVVGAWARSGDRRFYSAQSSELGRPRPRLPHLEVPSI